MKWDDLQSDDFKFEVRHHARQVVSEYGLTEQAIGLCGYCGHSVVATTPYRGENGMQGYDGPPLNAHCSRCWAKPVPMKMLDRRSEAKPAATENRRKP